MRFRTCQASTAGPRQRTNVSPIRARAASRPRSSSATTSRKSDPRQYRANGKLYFHWLARWSVRLARLAALAAQVDQRGAVGGGEASGEVPQGGEPTLLLCTVAARFAPATLRRRPRPELGRFPSRSATTSPSLARTAR